jgi:hypothetical protein
LLLYTSSDASVLLQLKPRCDRQPADGRVSDADLNQNPAVAEEVTVSISSSSGLSDTLTLVEQGADRGVFAATLPESYSNVPAGTVVTMAYFDASAATEKTSSTTAEGDPVPVLSDVSITDLSVPKSVFDGSLNKLLLTVANDKLATAAASGSVLLTGSDGSEFTANFTNLKVGGKLTFRFNWTADLADPTVAETVEWVASVTVNGQLVAEDGAITQVNVKPGKPK